MKRQATKNYEDVIRQKSAKLSQVRHDPETFLLNPFPVLYFWHSCKWMCPSIFNIAVRVFATPASSCSSERIFQITKKIVPPDHVTILTEDISQIITGNS